MRNLPLMLLAAGLCTATTGPLFAAGPAPTAGEAALLRAVPARRPSGYDWRLPRGFPKPAVPADNPMSAAKVTLGKRLFFETRLSVTGRYSCASCHRPERAYTDGRPLAIGATGGRLDRNAMALVNVAYNISFGWQHPEVTSLEQQMRQPLFNQHPLELGLAGREAALLQVLSREPGYVRQFAAAFAAPGAPHDQAIAPAAANGAGTISVANIIKAIAAYERTLIAGRSPFDRYVFEGEHEALTPVAKAGMALFYSGRLGCGGCHSGFNFAGNWRDSQGDTGPASFADDGTGTVVRVPTLRDITHTAPYMHDGRYATLDAVLDHYLLAGTQPDTEHGGIRDKRLRRFTLTTAERAQLVAFMGSLSSSAGSGP